MRMKLARGTATAQFEGDRGVGKAVEVSGTRQLRRLSVGGVVWFRSGMAWWGISQVPNPKLLGRSGAAAADAAAGTRAGG